MHRLSLICYDVACARRRKRLDKLLLARGERVLESLFECWLSAEAARSLQAQLRTTIDPVADRLALLPVCADCQRRVLDLGAGRPGQSCECSQSPEPSPSATPGLRRGRRRPQAWLV